MPIVNPSWLPFRVCSNDHAQLTGMPYIFFFKIKNCLNDDLFISCDDRIGKMLHNICISAVAMSLRWATSGPWASCFFFHFFHIVNLVIFHPQYDIFHFFHIVNFIFHPQYDSGYLLSTTHHTILYQSFWNFARFLHSLKLCMCFWYNSFVTFLAVLSSAQDELLWSLFVHRPSVRASMHPSVIIFKRLLLWSRWASFAQVSYGASLGWGNERLLKWLQFVHQDGRHADIW